MENILGLLVLLAMVLFAPIAPFGFGTAFILKKIEDKKIAKLKQSAPRFPKIEVTAKLDIGNGEYILEGKTYFRDPFLSRNRVKPFAGEIMHFKRAVSKKLFTATSVGDEIKLSWPTP